MDVFKMSRHRPHSMYRLSPRMTDKQENKTVWTQHERRREEEGWWREGGGFHGGIRPIQTQSVVWEEEPLTDDLTQTGFPEATKRKKNDEKTRVFSVV